MTLVPHILPSCLLVAGLLMPVSGHAATAYEVVRQEQTCPRAGEPRSLRQTVVVLDEAIVSGEAQANQRWTRMVVEAADAREASLGTLGARERFTVMVARRDGSELVPLFVGCSPNLSHEEAQAAGKADSLFDTFIGTGQAAKGKAAREGFASGIARAVAQVQKRAAEIAAVPVPTGGLLGALQTAGRLADLNHGLPRFLLVTPFQVTDRSSFKDVGSARERGFQLAEKTGIDFGRAEVYLAGATLGDAPSLEFARALVLGAKGSLAGVRSDGLPRLLAEPVSSRVYAGFIDYVGQRTPLQVRLAATAQGDLVNAWVETTLSRTTATPLDGKMLCKGETCELRGDGRFALAWFPDPQAEPAERGKLPFGGARNVEMTLKAGAASGRIFDPKVIFSGENGLRREDLRFDIQRVEDRPF
ncbi:MULTISPECIES: hypothetical protein [unclassified Methylobacterium]|uniref:hypothetical protein n=1 Tax=unclassified Methylobacterium TaxID=2615210 RepID=UPI0006F3FF03|nr:MULTISPECIES: hypothetical protein [unclassified Methylobacterium]KQP51454.1 hypothetical protein ASF39_10575 [Methylobacterium sp. Leaf108]KQT77385.1 hypothetical protein ASG59_12430 [Methylobacterium sp. Leaf466]